MLSDSLKLMGVALVGLFAQGTCQAQNWNGQSVKEKQRIHKMHLLE